MYLGTKYTITATGRADWLAGKVRRIWEAGGGAKTDYYSTHRFYLFLGFGSM